jgi:hypothetical protein
VGALDAGARCGRSASTPVNDAEVGRIDEHRRASTMAPALEQRPRPEAPAEILAA